MNAKSRKLMMACWMAASLAASAAPTWNTACFAGGTEKAPLSYKVGDEIVFTFNVVDVEPEVNAADYSIKWDLWTDDGQTASDKIAFTKDPITVRTKLSKPGFAKIIASVLDKKGRKVRRQEPRKNDSSVEFFGGAAADPEKLQGVPEPADFDAFWAKQKAALAAVPMKVERKELKKTKNGTVYSVSIACAGPRPATGYLTIPAGAAQGKRYPAQLITHGYGTRPHHPPADARPDIIQININAHGQELGRDEQYYKDFFESIKCDGKGYALAAKEHPDAASASTCFFAGMTWRLMRALEYVKSLPEWNGKDLSAAGGSQGGLQTMWAASLEPQLTVAEAGIPWCCDMGGNATMGRIKKTWGVEWTPAMGYFDPINLCRRIPRTCKVTITRAGLGDYTCPPSGVAILYNNMTCPKQINWMQNSTHGYLPPTKYRQTFTLKQP